MLSDAMNKVDVYMGVLRSCLAGDTAYLLSDVIGPLGPNQKMVTFLRASAISLILVFTLQVSVVWSPW